MMVFKIERPATILERAKRYDQADNLQCHVLKDRAERALHPSSLMSP